MSDNDDGNDNSIKDSEVEYSIVVLKELKRRESLHLELLSEEKNLLISIEEQSLRKIGRYYQSDELINSQIRKRKYEELLKALKVKIKDALFDTNKAKERYEECKEELNEKQLAIILKLEKNYDSR